MKLVHSLLATNLSTTPTDKLLNSEVWGKSILRRQIQWYAWIWSFMSAYEKNSNIELVTDSIGKIILCDVLKLPYKNVKIELNNLNQKFWFLGKIKTYSLQEEQFLHIDGDVIFKKYYPSINNYKLFGQNTSSMFGNYYKQIQLFLFSNQHVLKNIPSEFNFNPINANNNDYTYINSGVFGGTDIDLIKEYSNKVLNFFTDKTNEIVLSNFLDANRFLLKFGEFGFSSKGQAALTENMLFSMFEEYLPILMYKNKYGNLDNIGTILSSVQTDPFTILNEYKQQSKELGYVHLMDIKHKFNEIFEEQNNETAKNTKNIRLKIISTVRDLYPSYAKIVDNNLGIEEE